MLKYQPTNLYLSSHNPSSSFFICWVSSIIILIVLTLVTGICTKKTKKKHGLQVESANSRCENVKTRLQQRLQAASHSSPGWLLAGMSAFDSSSGTGSEQVGVNVLAYLFLLVLVLLAPGSYWVFQSPPRPCCLRSYNSDNSDTERRSLRFFLQSPHCATNCLQHRHSVPVLPSDNSTNLWGVQCLYLTLF